MAPGGSYDPHAPSAPPLAMAPGGSRDPHAPSAPPLAMAPGNQRPPPSNTNGPSTSHLSTGPTYNPHNTPVTQVFSPTSPPRIQSYAAASTQVSQVLAQLGVPYTTYQLMGGRVPQSVYVHDALTPMSTTGSSLSGTDARDINIARGLYNSGITWSQYLQLGGSPQLSGAWQRFGNL